ncbi:MAG: replicative DNA helicase [Candidatus Anammoxibacter sp.]
MNQLLKTERKLPVNEDAEVSVLGSMLLDNEVIDLVVQIIDKNSFYKKAHKQLFQSIIDLYDQGHAVDLVILKEELERRSILEEVGGIAYVMELEESVPMAANVEYYAKIVREKGVKRHLIETAGKIQQDAYMDSIDSDTLLDKSERAIFEITQQKYLKQSNRLYDILKDTFDRIDALQDKKKGRLSGLSTGYCDLDDYTCGLQASELIVLAARPSMGKTSLALNILENVGVVQGKAAVLFSLEMSAQQIAQNMLCSHLKLDAHKLRKGMLHDDDWQKLTLAMGVLGEAPIFIDDTPGLSILELRAKARRLKAQHDIQLIVVDYLQLLESSQGESRQQEISLISRSLKSLARELEVPVIAVSQLNRSVEMREGHKPRMSDLRESGSIEQDADVIILLHRDEYYNPEKNAGEAELNIAKQRNGPTGTVKLTFLPYCMRFETHSSKNFYEEEMQ